jgi:1-acyl-sn-glycerol-3-phosphate acyltransferase
MRSVLVSLWVWSAIGVLLVLWVPLMGLVWLFDRDPARYRTGYFLRILGRSFTYVNPFWDITVDGDFPDDPRRPYICVSNHLSQGDPPIIARVPWEMKWVAKAELFRLPVAGWLLRMSGDIPVDRRDRESRANVLKRARHYLERRCSVMFFPEGTRSRDGRVHRFANGAFRLAMKENVPVIPIAIDGTQEALPKHSIWFDPNPDPIRVRALPPVDPSTVDAGDATAFQRTVRARIVEQLADWRDVDPAAVDALHTAPDDADSDAADDGEASINLEAHSGSSEPSD